MGNVRPSRSHVPGNHGRRAHPGGCCPGASRTRPTVAPHLATTRPRRFRARPHRAVRDIARGAYRQPGSPHSAQSYYYDSAHPPRSPKPIPTRGQPALSRCGVDPVIDQVEIEVAAGKGGDGVVSFRREKFVPHGGPDGGDGGRGGAVGLVAHRTVTGLGAYRDRRTRAAPHGQPGSSSQRKGAAGEDLWLPVPVGCVVWELDPVRASRMSRTVRGGGDRSRTWRPRARRRLSRGVDAAAGATSASRPRPGVRRASHSGGCRASGAACGLS